MEVGPITEIHKAMRLIAERCNTRPGHTLTAHLREGAGVAIHPLHHVVTADARHCGRALGDLGRQVVRTPRTEPGLAFDRRLMINALIVTPLQVSKTLSNSCTQTRLHLVRQHALGNRASNTRNTQ